MARNVEITRSLANSLASFISVAFFSPCAGAEAITVGFLRTPPAAPIFIAKEKGYDAAEGLDVALVPFDAAEPIAVAAVAGSLDIALAGFTAAFFNLAGQSALRVIAGGMHEHPTFDTGTFVASDHAYEAGSRGSRISADIRWRSRRSARRCITVPA